MVLLVPLHQSVLEDPILLAALVDQLVLTVR